VGQSSIGYTRKTYVHERRKTQPLGMRGLTNEATPLPGALLEKEARDGRGSTYRNKKSQLDSQVEWFWGSVRHGKSNGGTARIPQTLKAGTVGIGEHRRLEENGDRFQATSGQGGSGDGQALASLVKNTDPNRNSAKRSLRPTD